MGRDGNRKLDDKLQDEGVCDSSDCGNSSRSQYPQTEWR